MTSATITEKEKLEIEALAIEIRDLAFIEGFIHRKIADTERFDSMLEKCINERLDRIRNDLKL
jgi:hypothetical protein